MQYREPRSVTLILGGVRTGKSRFAQNLAAQGSSVRYVATAIPVDAEMQAKIRRHQQERLEHCRIVEEPLDIPGILASHSSDFDLTVVDCLTIFVGNALVNGAATANRRIDAFVGALQDAPASVVLVSNEVGSEVVPAYPSRRQFRDLVGELNQRVAAVADNVVPMIAGLPLALNAEIDPRLLASLKSEPTVEVQS